jgi:hypothetical protein
MGKQMVIEVSERAANSARRLAAQNHQSVEDVLAAWIDRMAVETPVEWLSDADVLALADLQLEAQDQEELSALLAANQEGELDARGHDRLTALMHEYRQGMIHKAQATHEAVRRGLRPPLN